ncbi:hypothetical protein Tco_0672103 [Tanacetum coccineum]
MVPRTCLTRSGLISLNTASPKAIPSVVKGNKENVVKASACWVWRPKHKVLHHVVKICYKKDKNKAKRTKPSTRMERARKTKAEGVPIFYGPTRAHLMGRVHPDTSDKQLARCASGDILIRGCDVHTIYQGSKIDGYEAVLIETAMT